jgi:hypothetical protein
VFLWRNLERLLSSFCRKQLAKLRRARSGGRDGVHQCGTEPGVLKCIYPGNRRAARRGYLRLLTVSGKREKKGKKKRKEEKTWSFSSPGCFPDSSTILAAPSIVCAANYRTLDSANWWPQKSREKERHWGKGKERKGKERKGKERKNTLTHIPGKKKGCTNCKTSFIP